MRRVILLAFLMFTLAGVLLWVNCSKPLESLSDQDSTQTDTIFVVDTITIVDTVYVNLPDSSGPQLLCSQIASSQHEIVWMFRNPEGNFLLEFQANIDKVSPTQEIVIEIDDKQFFWRPAKDSEFIIERDLEQNASVRISTNVPHAYGHAIDICLNIDLFQ